MAIICAHFEHISSSVSNHWWFAICRRKHEHGLKNILPLWQGLVDALKVLLELLVLSKRVVLVSN
jgi:hypothetical protein